MSLLFNDLSLHGQFHDIAAFRAAIGRVMAMRAMIMRQFARELHCHRNVANAYVMHDWTLKRAAKYLSIDQRRALLRWLERHGPFWEDVREHGEDDWLECNGEIVTDTALGEAAYCLFHDIDYALVSLTPSSWLNSPLAVDWRKNGIAGSVSVPNYWETDKLREALSDAPFPLESWSDLEIAARSRYPNLTFTADCFAPLGWHPFNKSVAKRLLSRLAVLHKLKQCFNEQGALTPEGHELNQKHFKGNKAWFSDSSSSEKADFKKELTFPHPTNREESLFCTWHGKVAMPQLPLRIHFSWPIQASKSLYVVYVGPKITRR